MSNAALTIMIIGTLVFAAHLFTEIFSKKRVPDLLLLLIIGIIIGPVLGIVKPEDFGEFGSIFSTIALVIIIFVGGSELSVHNIRSCLKETVSLTLVGYFAAMLAVGLSVHFALGIPFLMSLFLGAVLGSSSTAITIPLTKQLKMTEKNKVALVLEASFTTVISFIVSLAIYKGIESNKFSVLETLGSILASFMFSALLGALGAVFWAIILGKVRNIKNSTFTTPAFVFIVYGINSMLGFSGEIAALAFGITLANIDEVYDSIFKKFFKKKPESLNANEKMLFEETAFLLRTFVFVYIGLSIKLADWKSILIGLGVTFILLVVRLIVVRFCIARNLSEENEIDAMYMSSQIPKGLAAAILAALLIQLGIPEGEFIKNIVFSVVFFSIITTSVAIPLIEKFATVKGLLRFILYYPRNNAKKRRNAAEMKGLANEQNIEVSD